MKRTILLFIAIALLVGAWTTNKAKGSRHAFHKISSAGAVIGNGAAIFEGPTFISIQEVADGSEGLFVIWSSSLASSPDSIYLDQGAGYDGNFSRGVDSLHYEAGSATYSVTASN